MAERYGRLGDYLAGQAAAGQRQVVLPFAQLEVAILGRPLPPPARGHRDWWRNTGHSPHAWYGWLRAGWFVGTVSLATETVTCTPGGEEGCRSPATDTPEPSRTSPERCS